MPTYLQIWHKAGCAAACEKLGMSSGPITYSETSELNSTDPTKEKNTQRMFKGLDEHNQVSETTKNADYIRGDLDKIKPHKSLIRRSNIENAFNTNSAIGEELGAGDPAYTQPHGGDKTAASSLSGGSAPVPGASVNVPGVKSVSSLMPSVPGMPKVNPASPPGAGMKAELTETANNMLGGNSILSRAARGNANPF